jgi:hypothetical protein
LINKGEEMLRQLSKQEIEAFQRKGYMCEHLLSLYSIIARYTALLDDNFPVFVNGFKEADVIFFGLKDRNTGEIESLNELKKYANTINIISPCEIQGQNIVTRYVDWDYHIALDTFSLDLKGKEYKRIRYRVNQAEKQGYYTKISRDLTANHLYLLSRYMSVHELTFWDYEEVLSLERYFLKFNHCRMIEVYNQGALCGFDVVDFYDDTGMMVVPLGIYLHPQKISDFMMYEDINYAKQKGYEILDVGPSCQNPGLQRFKEKWFAKPAHQLFVHCMQQHTPM